MLRIICCCWLVGLMLASACKPRSKANAESNPVLSSGALAPLTEAIAADTSKAEAWYLRGIALQRIGEDSLALEDFYHAARLDTANAGYASTIGDLLFEHKDVEAAKPWLFRALRHNPKDSKAHLKIAKLMLFTADTARVFSELNTVLRNDPYNPEVYFLKGMVYKDKGDTDRALSNFQTALNVAPDYRDAAIQLAQLYLAQGKELGLQYYESAFRIDTNDAFPIYAKGMYYQERGKYELAKEQYARCVMADPQYAKAIFATGFVLLQQDSFEKARRQFNIVTKIQPTNPGAYYNRGLCSEYLNDPKAAAGDYQQALTFDTGYANAREGLERIKSLTR